MIIGYTELEKKLEGRIKAGTLCVQSARGTLPLTVHWHMSRRAFDPVEVEALLADLIEVEAKRANRKIFNNTAKAEKGQHHE